MLTSVTIVASSRYSLTKGNVPENRRHCSSYFSKLLEFLKLFDSKWIQLYFFKVNNKDAETSFSAFIVNFEQAFTHLSSETRRLSNFFIINFEYVSHLFVVFLFVTLNR